MIVSSLHFVDQSHESGVGITTPIVLFTAN